VAEAVVGRGQVENVSVLVVIGVAADGYREVLGVSEGGKEDKASWQAFLRHLAARGLTGMRLFVSDKCLGLVEALGEVYSQARWQRCVVHFYRNVFTAVPKGKVREVAAMLKAIHAQEDRAAAETKAKAVVRKLERLRHIAGTRWGTRKYLTVERLGEESSGRRTRRRQRAG